MRTLTARALAVVVSLLAVPTLAFAQAEIAGQVRDSSGGVLPGVTVEATSPALIEQARTTVTDGTGQYRIINLRPGTYQVTFSLSGFATVVREGIEVMGLGVTSVNVELSVGALEETVTVTGETPVVDVQTTTRQNVIDHDIIDAIPTGRNAFNLGVLVPGLSMGGGNAQVDVGGSQGPETRNMTVHGSRGNEQRLMVNGIPLATMVGGGWGGGTIPNASGVQEIVLETSGASAEDARGGVRINFIPRDGGNTFAGTFFGSFANSSMASDNFSQELKDAGLLTPSTLDKNWDVNPGFGGPFVRDKLWYFITIRSNGSWFTAPGIFPNRNENDPTKWTYVPDESQPWINKKTWLDGQARFTWQSTARNKIAFTYDQQTFCGCPQGANAFNSPEAVNSRRFPVQRFMQLDWTSPVTSRVLLEASAIHRVERWGNMHTELGLASGPLNSQMISVVDQANGLRYRADNTYLNAWNETLFYRFAMSYITGAHAFKVGYGDALGRDTRTTYANQPFEYRFRGGVPNRITLRATPYTSKVNIDHELGIYAQDRWTINRLTLNGAIRYDYAGSSYPDQRLGPALLVPTRDLFYPARDNVSLHDVTPRIGASYDVFGNGRTAVKVSLNKYLQGFGTSGFATSTNPVLTLVQSVNRSWNDVNGDFVPDCDLLNPDANGECGGYSNRNFGSSVIGTETNPDLYTGWGHRFYNWEFSAGVQHEVIPRVSVDVSFFRRWYGNFSVTDDRALGPADFDEFSITAPTDPRLPNGGGYQIAGLYDVKPAKFGTPADNYTTFADAYGKETEHWNGVDVSVNARLPNGLLIQGGLSTGRTSYDRCGWASQLPESPPSISVPGPDPEMPLQFCAYNTKFLTQGKAIAAYTIPVIDVQLSGTYQSYPGTEILALYAAGNAETSLGRPLSGGARNTGNKVIVEPGSIFGDRFNEVDLRIGKLFQVGQTRTGINVDIFNLFNAATVLTYNNNFGAWQAPTSLMQARFFKVSVQFDY